ncbi:MAG: hypothetical protein Q9227_005916 [Pyrenula ochraceoflavens]
MPAIGDQHSTTENPFEEPKSRISLYTAQEVATLQSRLSKQLGPEFISARPGPSGQKVHYISAEKCINLANEVFGFNGWSSGIQNIQIDFVDENSNTGKISLGLSVIVRVTLKDGTFHEDIGYGHVENCKGKAAAFEKAKKEGTTDALKRALRNFGNVLGNCIYDKDYLGKVTKVKIAPTKWDVDNLHRHADYASVKKEPALEENATKIKEQPSDASTAEFDDDWDGEAFNDADFSEATFGAPDEVVLPAITTGPSGPSRNGFQTPPGPGANQLLNIQRPRPAENQTMARPQPRMPPPQVPAQGIPPTPAQLRSPITEGNTFSSSGVESQHFHPQSGISKKSEMIPDPAHQKLQHPQPQAAAGFWSARTIGPSDTENLPAAPAAGAQFNPHAESPSIRKTSGFDHRKSAPVSKKTFTAAEAGQAQATQSPLPGHAPRPPLLSANSRRDFINPSMDINRRIGGPSPYRPPAKRPPLGDLSNTPAPPKPTGGAEGGGGGEIKKPKLEGASGIGNGGPGLAQG